MALRSEIIEAGLPEAAEAFEAVYVAEDGLERRAPWELMPEAVAELSRPVRSFPSYRGQRSYPGWYWSATTGGLVGFESWVERDHLVALDFDPAVRRIVSQPFWLSWAAPGGKRRRHAPDFLAVLDDGSAEGAVLVVDSRPLELIAGEDRAAMEAADRACALVGWRYAVWGRMDRVVAANQRWLAAYRHPRCAEERAAGLLLQAFAGPRALMDGAEAAGDPLGTLPVLYHLLWARRLAADLSVALSDRTIVRAVAEPLAGRASARLAAGGRRG
jgi:hypothetical protein